MNLTMQIVVLLTLYQFQSTFSCRGWGWGGGGGGGGGGPPPASLYGKGKNDHNMYRDPNHWTPDYWSRGRWESWYKNWVNKQVELKKKDVKAVSDGWTDYDHTMKPRRWTHFPPGRGAQEPPPWAIIPNSYGKPTFCFDPPVRGTCYGKTMRWGFNPYAGGCHKFFYTGCGGNSNNFVNKRRCEEACMKLASPLCNKYGSRRDGTPLEGEPC